MCAAVMAAIDADNRNFLLIFTLLSGKTYGNYGLNINLLSWRSQKGTNPIMILASSAPGCLFKHPNHKKAPLRTPKFFCEEFLKSQFFNSI